MCAIHCCSSLSSRISVKLILSGWLKQSAHFEQSSRFVAYLHHKQPAWPRITWCNVHLGGQYPQYSCFPILTACLHFEKSSTQKSSCPRFHSRSFLSVQYFAIIQIPFFSLYRLNACLIIPNYLLLSHHSLRYTKHTRRFLFRLVALYHRKICS